ncbi:hypothetical protein ABIB38_002257 [Massilia sp. UYP11]|uniref:hypothetical protein n=1 Tax=Massilia sp. UYP11 TaxID=1756385 RepID=UPI003D1A9DF1
MEKKQRCTRCGSSTDCGCDDLYPLFAADGSDKEHLRRQTPQEALDEDIDNRKLSAILARLRTLWTRSAQERRASRLDGGTIFSDADWIALSESALFAKLREDDGGGGGPSQVSPPPAPTDGGNNDRDSLQRGAR